MNKNEMVCYGTDGSKLVGDVEKVVFPKTCLDVQKIINSSNNIVPRGSGSNLVGACIPNNSVVVDMKKMNKVTDFESAGTSGKVFVEAGVTIKELNEKLKAVGFEFPIFSDECSTLGGMVAMNSIGYMGGYGRIKDWIEEIEFVNGRGDILNISKSDLSDVCGMEGITGIITKIKLRIVPVVEKSISLFQTQDINEIWPIIKRLKLDEGIVMLRFYSPFVSGLLGFPEKYHIIIGFNSDRGRIKGQECKNILEKIKKNYYYLHSKNYYDSEDAEFFFDRIKEFVDFLDRLQIPYFGDLHLGIIYPFFRDDREKVEVVKMINRLNGKPGKYGIGMIRKDRLDVLQKKIIQRVKLRHDPFVKLNKGKVVDFFGVEEGKVEGKNKGDESTDNLIQDRLEESNQEDSKSSSVEDIETETEENKLLFETPEEKMEGFIKKVEGKESEVNGLDKEIEKFAGQVAMGIVEKGDVGKVVMDDNLDRKPVEISKSDKDWINKIMLNKVDEDDKGEDKNED